MKIKSTILSALIFFIASAYPAYACIKSSQRYQGPPQDREYVVTATNLCDAQKIVTVRIVDALTLEVVKSNKFALPVGETREVVFAFVGERLLSYEVSYSEE